MDSTEEQAGNAESRGLFGGVARHSLVYGLGMVISRVISFLMLPIYLRFLSKEDYGVMFLVEMTLDFVAIIGGAQLALGIFRFYYKTDVEEERRQIVSSSFVLVGLMYAAVGTVTFFGAGFLSEILFGDRSQLLVIQIASVNLAAGALAIVPMSLARVEDRSILYVGVNLAKMLLAISLNILFIVVMEIGVMGIFISSLLANLVIGGSLAVWLIRQVGINFSSVWVRQLLRYGLPLIGVQVATFVATFSDRYFLQAASDTGVVGVYGLAYQFGFLLVVVGFTPIDTVWGPKRFDIARSEQKNTLLARGFVLVNAVVITTALGIALYVDPVLRIIADPEFHAAAALVPVILVAYVLQSWATIQDVGILVTERTKFLTLANVGSAVVAVLGYWLLVPRFLMWGAACATVIAFFVRWLLTYVFSQKFWKVEYRWSPVLILTGWAAALCLVPLALPEMGVVMSLALRTGLVLVYMAGGWLLPVFDDEERAMILEFIGRVRSAVQRRRA